MRARLRRFRIVATVLLAIASSVVAWRRLDAGDPRDAKPAAVVVGAPAGNADEGAAHEGERPAPSAVAGASNPIPAARFAESAPAIAEGPAPIELRVEVLDRASKEKLPGALVHVVFFDDALSPEERAAAPDALSVARGVSLHAATTGDEGAATFHGFRKFARIRAVHGRRIADLWRTRSAPGRLPEEVVLRLTGGVDVVVLDAAGAPAAGVTLEATADAAQPWLRVGATDATGRAFVTLPGRRADADGWLLRPVVLGAQCDAAEIPAGGVDERRFTLPPCGALEIVPVDSNGETYSGVCDVTLTRRSGDGALSKNTSADPDPDAKRTTRGPIRFAYVAAGGGWSVEVRLHDATRLGGAAVAEGPHAGGTATVRVVCGEPKLVVAGRVVTTDGAPAPEAVVRLHVRDRGGPPSGAEVLFASATTDREGRFRTTVDAPATRVRGSYSAFVVGAELAGGAWKLDAQLPTPVEGVAALDDIVIESASPVVSGVVVDARGKPVKRATVELRTETGPTSTVFTDAAGKFEWTAPASSDGGAVTLAAMGPLLRSSAPMRVARGSRDVRIVLAPACAVVGSLKAPARSVRITIVGEPASDLLPGPEDAGVPRRELHERSGRFRIDGLAAGVARIEFSFEGNGPPVHVVDGVALRAGEICRDPRLQNVDLTAFGSVRSYRVLDAQGAPIKRASVAYRESSDEGWTYVGVDASGRALVATNAAPAEAFAGAEGFRPTALPVDRDVDVKLDPAPACVLSVRIARSLGASADETYFIHLNSEDARPRFETRQHDTVVGGETGILVASSPGKYSVGWLRQGAKDGPVYDAVDVVILDGVLAMDVEIDPARGAR